MNGDLYDWKNVEVTVSGEAVATKSVIHTTPPITILDMEDVLEKMEAAYAPYLKEMKDKEEAILKEVLTKLLRREPSPEDWKRLGRQYNQEKGPSYKLFFDGHPVGFLIFRKTIEGFVDAVGFVPHPELAE